LDESKTSAWGILNKKISNKRNKGKSPQKKTRGENSKHKSSFFPRGR